MLAGVESRERITSRTQSKTFSSPTSGGDPARPDDKALRRKDEYAC
jgi:hypothetical protein